MTREQLIQRIQSLSDEDLARVVPYLEAALDSAPQVEDLLEEVRLGRQSAEDHQLLTHEEVMNRVDEHLKRSS